MALSLARTRVLLVEDHPVNQKVLSRMLDRLYCAVAIAGDGEEGLRRAAEGFDLVLMDCSMPRMDGYEATRRIRALAPPIGQTPIVALTAHATAADRERCLAAGMNAWLAKPVTHDQLVATLREFTTWSAGTAAPEPGILDEAAVDRLRALAGPDDPDFFGQIVAEFAATARDALVEVRAMWRGRKLADMRRAVHRLEGASATIGAARLRESCGRIDTADVSALEANGEAWLDRAEEDVAEAVRALLARAGER